MSTARIPGAVPAAADRALAVQLCFAGFFGELLGGLHRHLHPGCCPGGVGGDGEETYEFEGGELDAPALLAGLSWSGCAEEEDRDREWVEGLINTQAFAKLAERTLACIARGPGPAPPLPYAAAVRAAALLATPPAVAATQPATAEGAPPAAASQEVGPQENSRPLSCSFQKQCLSFSEPLSAFRCGPQGGPRAAVCFADQRCVPSGGRVECLPSVAVPKAAGRSARLLVHLRQPSPWASCGTHGLSSSMVALITSNCG